MGPSAEGTGATETARTDCCQSAAQKTRARAGTHAPALSCRRGEGGIYCVRLLHLVPA